MINEVRELESYFCPYGHLDLQAACKIWEQVELCEQDLFEVIEEFRESCGYDSFESLDPVYCVLDHILQMARNHIEEKTGYDFLKDFSGPWAEIYSKANFLDRSYDYLEEAIKELKEKISLKQYAELMKDKYCNYVFTKIGIGAK